MPIGHANSDCHDTYLSDLDLNRSVVLGGDQSVGGGAFSGDVDIYNVSFVVLHLYYFEMIK